MNVIGKNLKTMASNVELTMVDEVMAFHNKANINLDVTYRLQISPHTLNFTQLQQLERSDYEVSPFHDANISCATDDVLRLHRGRSAMEFAEEAIDFSKTKSLLKHGFAANQDGYRPYPSGGALYPVEVFCAVFEEKMTSAPVSGFYHYRPSLNVLQLIKKMDDASLQNVLFKHELVAVNAPNFALIYVGVMEKLLVKYRYRGYRYALMEAGCMVQQADLIAQQLLLKNKLYSGFNDHELVKAMGLDPLKFMPFVVQSFGV